MKKNVRILSRRSIPLKGNIMGPILTPFQMDVNEIFPLLMQGIEVEERLDNGDFVKLGFSNFNKVNVPPNVIKDIKPQAPVQPEQKKVEEKPQTNSNQTKNTKFEKKNREFQVDVLEKK